MNQHRTKYTKRSIKTSLLMMGIICGVLRVTGPRDLSADEARPMGKTGLFGVEIGGPEDGHSLTDPAAFQSARQVGANFIDLRPIWSTLEIKPGEYDWSMLDTAIANAESVDLPVTITVRFFENQIPEWLADENTLDQDGAPFFGYNREKSRSVSYWGPKARSSYLRLVDTMVQRYRDESAIVAWQFFYGYNDSFYLGMWTNRNTVYDYSEFSQEKYRHYLSDIKQFSLAEINRRYGTRYQHWSNVGQPKPSFYHLNAGLEWHDFQDYRMWSIERMFDDIDRTVRRHDSRPLIMYYGGTLHHSAHQLSVYDIGLRLLQHYGGALDITCFEDPVPAEIGSGMVRSYGITLMAEAWQVPPPLKDFRRMFFHIFSLGVKSYQLVGDWEKMEISVDEFKRTSAVFADMIETEPIRARVAGLISYRTILSHVPARAYINPTLALVPVLQHHQYSLDWHSDLSPLDDLDGYPALLDANSEVLTSPTIDTLVRYVERGGRLVLLPRSGRYALEEGKPDYPLLERLQFPQNSLETSQSWAFGKGFVTRINQELDWKSPEGTAALLNLMEWLKVERPITGTPGLQAALTRSRSGIFYAVLFWPNPEATEAGFSIRNELLDTNEHYRLKNLFNDRETYHHVSRKKLTQEFPVAFSDYELKVLKITPE